MTSLSGKILVPKTNGRIAFRGMIDTLAAEIIEAQVLASERGEREVCANLGEVLDYLGELTAAEVKETPLAPPYLFGMVAEEIHAEIENTRWADFPVPRHTQGAVAARINTLRAKVREAELAAVRVFGPQGTEEAEGRAEREDIILAMNRLSGALWWLFARLVQKKQAPERA